MLSWKLSGWLTKQLRIWLASIAAFTFEVVILSSLQCCRNQKISIYRYLLGKKKYLLWRDVYLDLLRCNHSSTGNHPLINIYLLLNSKPRADNSVVLTQGLMSSSDPGANNSDVVTQLLPCSGKNRLSEEPDCRVLPATPLFIHMMSHAHHESWFRKCQLLSLNSIPQFL